MAPGLEKFQGANWALRVSWAVVEPRSGKSRTPFPPNLYWRGYVYRLYPPIGGPPIQSYRASLYGRPMWAYAYRGSFKWLYLAYLSQASKDTVG